MKVILLHLKSGREPWAEQAEELYQRKIGAFIDFEILGLKSKGIGRDHLFEKVKAEEEQILSYLDETDLVWLLDEKGKTYKESRDFASSIARTLENSPKRWVIIVGGAYGVSDKIKERAQACVSLSNLTMNHHFARTVFLEQLYRAFTLIKGIPYHND